MARIAAALVAVLLFYAAAACAAPPLPIVAAENFYADVARQIGGDAVSVRSILNSPDQDPHLFEPSPSDARAISNAIIVIYNGIGYDPWMPRLLHATGVPPDRSIVVATLLGRKPGDNPHVWYDPAAMPALAEHLCAMLAAQDPAHADEYRRHLAAFQASMQPLRERITTLRQRLAGTAVTATEPVFGWMFAALGLQVRNMPFQIAVMNNTEPAASAIGGFESDLRSHAVKLLVYNRQASDPIAERMRRLAETNKIPVVGVTETEPAGITYQAWIGAELDAIDHAIPR